MQRALELARKGSRLIVPNPLSAASLFTTVKLSPTPLSAQDFINTIRAITRNVVALKDAGEKTRGAQHT